jgi:hypothetical protein
MGSAERFCTGLAEQCGQPEIFSSRCFFPKTKTIPPIVLDYTQRLK